MNILVIGGTGFISGSTVKILLEKEHHVTVFTRGKSKNMLPEHPNLRMVYGDRNRISDLAGAVGYRIYDAVYDFVAYLPRESELAIRVLRGKTKRFIHCSTVSVYMVSNEIQCPITEDQANAPLMPFQPRNPFGMDYGILKRQCEDVLWRAHDEKQFPVSMLRPPFVSGPGDPGARDYFWIERIRDGHPILVPGNGDFVFQQVYVQDVAKAFVSLLEYEASIGQAYNVAAEEIFSLNDYLKLLGRLLERNVELVHVPQDVFDGLPISTNPFGDVFPFNTRRKAVFSLLKIKKDLHYISTPFKEWLPLTIDWYLNDFGKHSTGYDRRDQELDFIQKWRRAQSECVK
ncbi:NAD-dependent epimerase/dehydratase family protein [candidate division KSB1 bacterium]|nr:NAD-dependent epimerase/dehydratase family protein [candidate division KSB1 bacterium]